MNSANSNHIALTLQPSGVAILLGIPEERFRRKFRGLMRQHAFPPPLPGIGLIWSEAAIRYWISTGTYVLQPQKTNQPDPVHHLRLKYTGANL